MKTDMIDVMGVGFNNITMDEAVEAGLALISQHRSAYVVTPNPEIVMAAMDSTDFRRDVNGADLVLPDGIGIIYGARILGTPLKAKVPGIDFAAGLFEKLSERGGSVFLFGAKPGIAEKAAGNIKAKYPGLRVVGCENGYYKDDAPIIAHINEASPDLLLVCLGAPKQERFMAAYSGRLNAGLMAGLGGSLDVFAGTVKRAPKFWQRLGLEWFYRLITDPKRIKRMIKLPVFLFLTIGSRLRRK